MTERPLIQWIVTAFRNLGGQAHLSAVYDEVRRLGYDGGGEDLDKLIRARIYEHSSESPKFTGNLYDDRFRRHGSERSGIWELRQERPINLIKLERLTEEEAGQGLSSNEPMYVPHEGDWRKIVERQIRERRGQQQFRDVLRARYEGRCLVTGCEILAVLEAAHISPYRGEDDNHPAAEIRCSHPIRLGPAGD